MSNIKISDYSLGARWIHTMTGPPLERHFVNVSGGRIESFSVRPAFGEIYDFGDEAQILPGTVNMHAHLELSQLERPLDCPVTNGRRSMADWVAELMRFRRSPEYDAERGIWNALLRPELQSETVAVADIVPPDLPDIPKLPKTPVWCRFTEIIDWKGERIDDFEEKDQRSTGAGQQNGAAAPIRPSVLSTGLSPHAPQTVHRDVLASLVKRNVPLAMHLAETPEEIEFLQTGGGPLLDLMRKADPEYDPRKVRLGKRPLDYLKLLAEAPHAFVIHGNYLDDGEIEFLADHRDTMAVVYCPRSHAYFAASGRNGEYPLKKMLDRGVRVLLGTDSLASTPDLSLVHEIDFVLKRHPDVPVETVFRMGTLDGAETLDLRQDFGMLAPGRPARFAFHET